MLGAATVATIDLVVPRLHIAALIKKLELEKEIIAEAEEAKGREEIGLPPKGDALN